MLFAIIHYRIESFAKAVENAVLLFGLGTFYHARHLVNACAVTDRSNVNAIHFTMIAQSFFFVFNEGDSSNPCGATHSVSNQTKSTVAISNR